MAVSNSSILIKRSSVTGIPGSLKAGELAYSYVSNTLFLGTANGLSVSNVGGTYYTTQIDGATSLNTPGAIVRRDAAGNSYFGNVVVTGTITGTITAVANSAQSLAQSQNFGINGGDISASNVAFNGTAPVILNASLNNVPGLTAGSYGGTTQIPTIQVAANGRVIFAGNNAINTSFNIGAGGASNTINSGATLYFNANSGSGVVTSVAANTVQIGVDSTILRSNTSAGINAGATQTISTNLSISGNLTTGNIIPSSGYMSIGTFTNPVQELYVSSNSLNVGGISISNSGSILTLGGGATDMSVSQNFGSAANVASMANVGFNFVKTGGTVAGDVNVTGNLVVRGTTTQIDTVTETTTAGTLGLAANNTGDVIDIGVYGTYQSASVNKLTGLVRSPGTSNYFLFSGINQTELAGNTIPVADFTGANSATLVANVQAYQISSSGQVTVASLVANTAIAVSSGGTGANTLPTGQIVLGNGTGAVSALANVSLAAGAYGNANTIAVQTTDVYGRTTAITNTAIAITAAQITSGQLPVSYGGTGASTLPTGQILIGDGTGPISVLANSALAAGAYGNANTIAVTTTDVYGRITGVTNTAISIAPTQINSTTGTGAVVLADNPTLLGTTTAATLNVTALNVTSLNVTYSNVNSITTNSVNVGALTYAASGAFVVFGASANSYQQVVVENSNTGTQASADFIVSNGISTDGAFYGDFGMNGQNFVGTGSLNVANTVYLYSANVDLAIGTSTSNAIHFVVNNGATDSMTINANGAVSLASALGLAYGGTGQTSFTSDGIIYGNGSGALQATVAAGVSDQAYTNQVLTVTNAGVPVWSSAVDGGTF